ncbi:MAG TPA: lipoyl(octanoyl) transferase LipB [Bacillota bacterium]|jgi:lipoate-protein ligase B
MKTCSVWDIGRLPYREYMRFQDALVRRRIAGEGGDVLVLAEHDPVLTYGRDGGLDQVIVPPEGLAAEGVALEPTDRGGNITYHGPGQLMIYPILDLRGHGRDIHLYLRRLEETVIRALRRWGINGGLREGLPGVWVDGGGGGGGRAGLSKIAAVGIAVNKWVTSHGSALNLDPNLAHFSLINPCGMPGAGVTSVKALAGRDPGRVEAVAYVSEAFAEVFGVELSPVAEDTVAPKSRR